MLENLNKFTAAELLFMDIQMLVRFLLKQDWLNLVQDLYLHFNWLFFLKVRNLGKPVDLAGKYYKDGADEVCLALGWFSLEFGNTYTHDNSL